jgi:hypothetical protein
MEEVEISSAILKREEELQQKLQNACRQQEEYWRQKSRRLWLKYGDRNTSYFLFILDPGEWKNYKYLGRSNNE